MKKTFSAPQKYVFGLYGAAGDFFLAFLAPQAIFFWLFRRRWRICFGVFGSTGVVFLVFSAPQANFFLAFLAPQVIFVWPFRRRRRNFFWRFWRRMWFLFGLFGAAGEFFLAFLVLIDIFAKSLVLIVLSGILGIQRRSLGRWISWTWGYTGIGVDMGICRGYVMLGEGAGSGDEKMCWGINWGG